MRDVPWNGIFRKFRAAMALASLIGVPAGSAQEAIMDEVTVEGHFDFRLDLPRELAVQSMVERLTAQAETERLRELQSANRNPLSITLDLTKYSPIPLGPSEDRIDTFFLQNFMRADLNPRQDDPLSLPH